MSGLRKSLGQRLRRLRDEQQLGVEQVALWTGVDRTHLYAIERGSAFPSVDLLAGLAQVYRVDVADLFTFPDEHRRHRLREVARLVPNAKLPDVIVAIEARLGAEHDRSRPPSSSVAEAKPQRSRRKKSR